MKIIIINPKSEFTPEQISRMEGKGIVVFLQTKEEVQNYINNESGSDFEEKVVLLGPEVIDWKLENKTIDKINNLKGIFLPTTSHSWIDGEYLRSKNIVLTNVPKYSTEAVAEYSISMMLNLSKKLPLVIKNGWEFNFEEYIGRNVKDKTMGIIGLGAIGTRIAELGLGMGMNVIYWSRKSRNNRFKYMELDDVFKNSDYLFPALVRNVETEKIITKDRIDMLKRSSFIIDITHENLFDFEYTAEKVKKGELSGVAFESDTKKIGDYKGNVYITPPIAWLTKESLDADMEIWTETACAFLKGNPINIVN